MGITVKSVSTNVGRKQAFTDAAVSVLSGLCANPTTTDMSSDAIAECAIDVTTVLFEKIDKLFEEKEEEAAKASGLMIGNTGLLDHNGNFIFDGDIFVYSKEVENIPEDLVENYKEKYADRISLHPVFWSEDMHDYCSDVYRDEDRLWTYNSEYIFVVTNKEKHPELYNH